jgi:DNA polymerase-3 subunit epsilon
VAFDWIGKSEDGETITLHRLRREHFSFPVEFSLEWQNANQDLIRTAAVLDVETSGLNVENSKIIEIGIRTFRFHRVTGEVVALGEEYSAFQDPGAPLSEEVKKITGITDDMVRGKIIDWTRVDGLLEGAQLVIAHNAGFDRPFVEIHSKVSPSRIWGCSLKQIDWTGKGFPSQKLDLLSIFHGFFTDSHRALNDADALLFLLSRKDRESGSPYLLELIQQARKPSFQIFALSSPFDSKDLLKARSYRWDGNARTWWKEIDPSELAAETEWLENHVYMGPFRGKTLEIPPTDHFKMKANPS